MKVLFLFTFLSAFFFAGTPVESAVAANDTMIRIEVENEDLLESQSSTSKRAYEAKAAFVGSKAATNSQTQQMAPCWTCVVGYVICETVGGGNDGQTCESLYDLCVSLYCDGGKSPGPNEDDDPESPDPVN